MNGKVEQAVKLAERCLELAPENEEFRARMKLFRSAL